jgi:XTP/dITP diphosphohydrolase
MTSLHLPQGARLVAATHNPGKARELQALLEGRFQVISAGELGLPEPDETETTFVGNAVLKARAAADRSGLIALADDSGLSVNALDGAPGVFSARWAGPGKDFNLAMAKVRERLEETGSDDMSAFFSCALAVAWPSSDGNGGGPIVAVEGRVDGNLTFPPRGARGFGYDPIFVPEGGVLTFGEMDPEAKDAVSHRARAFAQLKAALF